MGYTARDLYNAAEQQHSDYGYQPARQARRVVLVPPNTQPKGYEPDCQNPQSNSNADLCAQWAAVDQVTEANRLNALNIRLALFIALLTLTGTGLLVWTFIETRSTSRRELRAYLNVTNVKIEQDQLDPTRIRATAVYANSGETPALEVQTRLFIFVGAGSGINPDDLRELPLSGKASTTVIGKGGFGSITHVADANSLEGHEAAEVLNGDFVIAAFGSIDYRDIFDAQHETRFQAYIDQPTRALGLTVAVSPTGNSMT